MSREIDALEELVELLRGDYEKALQSEEATQVAYRSGILYGVELAIIKLESLMEGTAENCSPLK